MNIQTVAENLRNTIDGKEKLFATYEKQTIKAEDNVSMAIAFARVEFLRINIAELKRILGDVEQCEQFNNYEKWDGDE